MPFGQLILEKSLILLPSENRLKCTKYYFGTGVPYNNPSEPLAGFKWPTSKGRVERGWNGEGRNVLPSTFE